MPSPTLIAATLAWIAALSVVAWMAIWSDKRRAERGRARIPERTLHALELLGGWPGAMLARRRFRHKTRKLSYRIVSTLCAATHIAVVVLLWRLIR